MAVSAEHRGEHWCNLFRLVTSSGESVRTQTLVLAEASEVAGYAQLRAGDAKPKMVRHRCAQHALLMLDRRSQSDAGGRDFGFERRADFFLWRTLGTASTFFFWRPVRDFVEAFFCDSGLRGFRP